MNIPLFQLNIPDANDKPLKKTNKTVVGIDLGTTNSLVATVIDGQVKIIEDENQRLIPSVVVYVNDKVIVGNNAKQYLMSNPDSYISSVKRLMGKSVVEVKNKYQYNFDEDADLLKLIINNQSVTPVEISAEILKHINNYASEYLNNEIEGVVITVPAYFDDAQRQATKDAARLANLKVLRLLNEPTAAALAYGLENAEEGIYVVYDLGGGTFDVSVLKLSKGVFEVIATAGDTSLGGDDYDHLLTNLVIDKLNIKEPQIDIRRRILNDIRQLKVELTDNDKSSINFNDCEVTVTRDEFIDVTKELTDKTISILDECLSQAVKKEDIKGVILVGGSSRMPQISTAIKDYINVEQFNHINPDEVVALGAAAQADILAGNRSADTWVLLDVTPLSLGIETMGGLVEKIIPRNSAIPISRAQEFTTHKDGQTAMSIHVVQGERELVSDCRSLARFSLKDIPPMKAGTARIRVTYSADADGILSVTGEELKTGKKTSIEIKPSYGLSEDEITSMLQAASVHAKDDIAKRNLIEVKNQANSYLEMLSTAMKNDAKLLGDDEVLINKNITNLKKSMQGDDSEQITKDINALDKSAENFAQLRMEKAIKDSLTGKKVSEIK